MTIHVKAHTRVINGKLVTVAAHDKGGKPKVIHHDLDDEFANLDSTGAFEGHAKEPEPSVDDEFAKLDESGAFNVDDEFDKLSAEGAFDEEPKFDLKTLEAIGGKEWKSDDGKHHRVYFNGIPKLYAEAVGEQKAASAGSFKGCKVFYDFEDNQFHTKNMEGGGEGADIIALLKKKATEQAAKAPEEQPAVEAVDDDAIPEGWSGIKGGLITNQDPINGGIVDKSMAGKGWFAVPNMDGIPTLEGFKTKKEALQALADAVKAKQEQSQAVDSGPKVGETVPFSKIKVGMEFSTAYGTKWTAIGSPNNESIEFKYANSGDSGTMLLSESKWAKSMEKYCTFSGMVAGPKVGDSGPKVGQTPDFRQLQPGMVLGNAQGTHSFVVIEKTPDTIWVQSQNGDVLEYSDELWKSYEGKPDKAPTLASFDDADFKPNTGNASLVHNVGDTKVINGKNYVFNANHRWELVEEEQAAQTSDTLEKLQALEAFKGTSIDGVLVKKNADWNNLYIVAKSDENGKALPKKVKDAIAELHPSGYKNKKLFYIVHGDNLGKLAEILDGKKNGTLKGKPKPKAAPAKTATPAKLPENFPFKQIGKQAGSNEGGLFEDSFGKKWYIKFPASEDHAKNELLAAKLYKLAGLDVPHVKLVKKDGKVGIASAYMEGLSNNSDALKAGAKGAKEGFGVDAWLANWDAVGLGYDNMLIDQDGKAIRIDPGGALKYRAQGTAKTDEEFGTVVSEIDSLRNSATNPQAASVFGSMTTEEIERSVAKVIGIPDDVIDTAVAKFGPGNNSEKRALAAKLKARKAYLAKRFPAADAIANPPAPDPTNLQVDPAKIGSVPNFSSWKDTGKPLSSNTAINAANQKACQEIYDFALKGNLVALKSMQMEVVDKNTGAVSMKPAYEHPSKWVREYYDTIVGDLEVIANPASSKAKAWDLEEADDIRALSDAFPAHHYGISVSKVPPNERLGFWISLGNVADHQMFMPQSLSDVSSALKSAVKKAYQGVSSLLKGWLGSVQSSGSNNQPYRDGSETDYQGRNCRDVLEDAYAGAMEFPEGTTIRKWIVFPTAMEKQLEACPEGHVFQNPGSMCCSMSSQWEGGKGKGFGNHLLTIRYAKGAKGLPTAGSGEYDSEQEITTLPGQRFMIMNKGKLKDGSLHLELLMLPPDETYVANIKQKAAA